MKKSLENIPQLFVRWALAVTMLSAVADRFGLWGTQSAWGNWDSFVQYTQQLLFFLPSSIASFFAIVATGFEILFPLMLMAGFKTRMVALGTGFLLFSFALSMSVALGIKASLDYSVWIGSAAAFLLSVQNKYAFSIDSLTKKKLKL